MSKLKLTDIYTSVRHPKYAKDFWRLNQELSNIEPFNTFRKKKNSTSVMMAIYMVYDPKSQLINSGLSRDQMKKDVAANYLKKPNFKWSEYSDIISAYNQVCKTRIEKELDKWYEQLLERQEYIDSIDYAEEPDLKEDLILNTDKHFEKYQNIMAALTEERQLELMKGNYTPSELELWFLETQE